MGVSPHIGLRTPSMTVPSSGAMSIGTLVSASRVIRFGPVPEPISEVSTGRNRSPSTPVGSRLRNRIRTGRSLVATIVGPEVVRVVDAGVADDRGVAAAVGIEVRVGQGEPALPGTTLVESWT